MLFHRVLDAVGYHLLVSIHATFAQFHCGVSSFRSNHFHMVVVYILQEFYFLIAINQSPRILSGIEIEFHHALIGCVGDSVAIFVGFNNIFAVLAINRFCAGLHGIFSRPKFNAVEHQQVGQAGEFIHRNNPESHKHEFVHEFATHLFIPSEHFIGELKLPMQEVSIIEDTNVAIIAIEKNLFFIMCNFYDYKLLYASNRFSTL